MIKILFTIIVLSSFALPAYAAEIDEVEISQVVLSYVTAATISSPAKMTVAGKVFSIVKKERRRISLESTELLKERFINEDSLNEYLQAKFCGQEKLLTGEVVKGLHETIVDGKITMTKKINVVKAVGADSEGNKFTAVYDCH